MKNFEEFKEQVKPGTFAARVFYSALFLVLGLLFVKLGFWKAVFVALLTLLGYFIGATSDMRAAIKKGTKKVDSLVNKVVVYTKEDLDKVLKKNNAEKEKESENVVDAAKEIAEEATEEKAE